MGRPKGSKNKKTLALEGKLAAAPKVKKAKLSEADFPLIATETDVASLRETVNSLAMRLDALTMQTLQEDRKRLEEYLDIHNKLLTQVVARLAGLENKLSSAASGDTCVKSTCNEEEIHVNGEALSLEIQG